MEKKIKLMGPDHSSNKPAANTYEVEAGPSKFDLSVALFHKNGDAPHRLLFTLKDGRKAVVTINSVSIEDGSRESWLISGYILGFIPAGCSTSTWENSDPWLPFNSYFETRQHTGTFTFTF